MRYWAFISYSRADVAWAKRAQRSLERLAIPRSAMQGVAERGLSSRHVRPIFRDVDELAASSDLGAEIRDALDQSAYLIVICSRRSARSHWVAAEIRHVIGAGRADRILLLVVDGEPRVAEPDAAGTDVEAAFSSALADLPSEPLWVDARPQAEGAKRALIRLAAGIVGVAFDDLWRREQRRRRTRWTVAATLAAAVAVSVGGLFYVQSQPVDVAECPLGAVAFRDPWAGGEFSVESVGVDYIYLCEEEIASSLDVEQDGEGCLGPYGPTVLKGVLRDDPVGGRELAVYFVYHMIKGAPCCWWDALDEADAEEIVGAATFRWLAKRDEPLMNDFGFASIEIEDPVSTVSSRLDMLTNPLIGSVCKQTRLEATLSSVKRRFARE